MCRASITPIPHECHDCRSPSPAGCGEMSENSTGRHSCDAVVEFDDSRMKGPGPPCLQVQTSPSCRDTRPRSSSLYSHPSWTEPGLHSSNAPYTASDAPTMRDQRTSRRNSRRSFDGEDALTPPLTSLCPASRKFDATDDKCSQPLYDPQSIRRNARKSFDNLDELCAEFTDFKCSPLTTHRPPPIAPYFVEEPKRRTESASRDSIVQIGEELGTAKEIDSDDDSPRSPFTPCPLTVIDTSNSKKFRIVAKKHTVG